MPGERRRGPGVSMRMVILLTVVVTIFAAAVAFWMYWAAGALIGSSV
jgi:hypothetical protein